VLAAGCGASRSPASRDVLAWVPKQAFSVELIDWSSINHLLGVGRSQPVQRHVRALLDTRLGRVVPSTLYGYDQILDDLFGWDLRDLTWEVQWREQERSATVISFLPGFNMTKVETSLERNGYTRSGDASDHAWVRPSATALGPLPFRSIVVHPASRVLVLSVDTSISISPGNGTWDTTGLAADLRPTLRKNLVALVSHPSTCAGPPAQMLVSQVRSFNRMRRPDIGVLSFGASGRRVFASATSTYPSGVDVRSQARYYDDFVRMGKATKVNSPYWAFIDIHRIEVTGRAVRFDLGEADERLKGAFASQDWPFTLCARG
jgi:hypothetical protein